MQRFILSVMKWKVYIGEGISLLFILLFTYAVVTKLLQHETFEMQLEQSPLLGSYAESFSILVPGVEIIAAILLIIPNFRLIGLWIALILMMVFTLYIIYILTLSESIPCSCGGVIASLTWSQHLLFNIGGMLLAGVGIYYYKA